MSTLDPTLDPAIDLEAAKVAQRLKKSDRMRDDRQLEPWERYRALNDLLDSYIDMIEIADRKARFAMIVLGALNALNLVLLTRPQLAGPSANPGPLATYAAIYIAVSLFLLTRTIGVLRPRAGALNRELSNHVRNLAIINVEKYRALDHVYHGLVVLAVLTALFGAAIVVLRLYM